MNVKNKLPTSSGQSVLLLSVLVQVLEQSSIKYLVIGALASAVYGAVRSSIDADAILSIPKDVDLDKALINSLTDLGLKVDYRKGDVFDPLDGIIKIEDSYNNLVDLIIGIKGFDNLAFSRGKEVDVLGNKFLFVGLEDFIAMKLFAGGPQDIQDVRDVLTAPGIALDHKLLRVIVNNYNADLTEKLNEAGISL